MATARKFTGSAQDYLDWFKLDLSEELKVVIPNSQTGGSGLPAHDEDFEQQQVLPDYFNYQYGKDYVTEYQEQLIEDYKLPIQESCQQENGRKEYVKDFESVDMATVTTATIAETLDPDAEKAQVYLHYDFTKRNRTELPINFYEKEIIRKLKAYPVTVIKGDTGCGKSTQVPQFILDDAVRENKHVNIVVTQPRKIAAISLARRVCEERGWKLGKLVGYQVGLDNTTDLDTRLSFVTTEVLVQKLIHRKTLNDYTHIILDEVHERDEHTDFAMLVVKKLLFTVSRSVKVILMSATINSEKFAKYFKIPAQEFLFPAPIISVSEGPLYSVQCFYLDQLKDICIQDKGIVPRCATRLPQVNLDEPGISDEMYNFVRCLIHGFDILERREQNIENKTKLPEKRGAVLAFLPGLMEIEKFIEVLKQDHIRYKWHVLPLHSSITAEEQRKVFYEVEANVRKIIVSTNIAESSITVKDVKYVVDFCLTKNVTCDPVTNYTSLKLSWTSKASCDQRKGRCGRVSDGRVYRLVDRDYYHTFSQFSVPELCRTPLTHVVLKTKVLDMGEPQSLLALAMDPPELHDIHRTILTLKQMGALAVKADGTMTALDGDLTYLGRVVAQLPLDPHISKLILMGHLFGCLRETVIIAAGLSLKSFHSRPFQDELRAYISKISWSFASFSDCIAIYNAYSVWQFNSSLGKFPSPYCKEEKNWAKSSYVQLDVLREVHTLVQELNKRLERLKINQRNRQNPEQETQHTILRICMAAAFFPHYYKRDIPQDYEREICRELMNYDRFHTVVVSGIPQETNFLYTKQLKEIFKDCSKNIKIYYYGSKAYVIFPKSHGPTRTDPNMVHFKDIPGKSPTSMHLALKMRQIPRHQKQMELSYINPDEAKSWIGEPGFNSTLDLDPDESFSHMSSISNLSNMSRTLGEGHIRTITYENDDRIPSAKLPSPTLHTWEVGVIYVENAGHFWVKSDDDAAQHNFSFLYNAIRLQLETGDQKYVDPEKLEIGDYCLAPWVDPLADSMEYYRARVEEMHKEEENVMARVFYCDFGNNYLLNVKELIQLSDHLTKIPMMAVECMLSEVKSSSQGEMYWNKESKTWSSWTSEATCWFKRHTLNKHFISRIYSVVDDVVRLELLQNTSSGGLTSINQQLIKNGFAVSAEEFLLSKQNHDLRAIYTENVALENNPVKMKINPLIRSNTLSSLSSSRNLRSYERKIRIKGPDSPLLLRFVALSRIGYTKAVRVDTSSVNSTSLDFEPENKHDRMIVASLVSLNSSETCVTLRDTTLMPHLPGLLPLSLLLFGPVAELRVNKKGTKYIGALVGLGFHPDTNQAIYPDEDIEISFDIPFTDDDLEQINKIRFTMNVALEEAEDITDKFLVETQSKLRKMVLNLIGTENVKMNRNIRSQESEPAHRPYCEPESFHRPYRWNLIPQEAILPPCTVELHEILNHEAFPLHFGVALQEDESAEAHTRKIKEEMVSLLQLEKQLTKRLAPPSEKIDTQCIACKVKLVNVFDLRLHLSSPLHKTRVLILSGDSVH